MRIELPGLRALVTDPAKRTGQTNAQALAANGAEVLINGRETAQVESVIDETRGSVPSGRFVRTPGDTAGEINIRVNNVDP